MQRAMIPCDARKCGETISAQSILHCLTEHSVSAKFTRQSSGDLPQCRLRERKWPVICERGIRGVEWCSQVAYVGTKTNSFPCAPPKHADPVNLSMSGEEGLYPRMSESRGVASVMHKVQSCGCDYRVLVMRSRDSRIELTS